MNLSIQTTVTADSTLLDIVSKWPATDAVFRRYDDQAGVCLCCSCLFDTLEEIAKKYELDLNGVLREINDIITKEKHTNKDVL
jgi:iron-sulfur cluster repair protein YtfE (RIC family)